MACLELTIETVEQVGAAVEHRSPRPEFSGVEISRLSGHNDNLPEIYLKFGIYAEYHLFQLSSTADLELAMTQQTIIKPQTLDLAETHSKPISQLEDLLGRLAETVKEQSRLRLAGDSWDELAAVQSTLHELRAALAMERSLSQLT